MVDRSQLDAQLAYYRERAAEYDDAYQRANRYDFGSERNAEWFRSLAVVQSRFDAVRWPESVLELAAGTGHWTERLAQRVRTLHVIDGAPEVVERNRERLGLSKPGVTFEVADLFEWAPLQCYGAVVACFWLSHVPDELLGSFLMTCSNALAEKGFMVFIDDLGDTDTDDAEPIKTRLLNDGRAFSIVKRRRSPALLRQSFEAAGFETDIESVGGDFFFAVATRAEHL